MVRVNSGQRGRRLGAENLAGGQRLHAQLIARNPVDAQRIAERGFFELQLAVGLQRDSLLALQPLDAVAILETAVAAQGEEQSSHQQHGAEQRAEQILAWLFDAHARREPGVVYWFDIVNGLHWISEREVDLGFFEANLDIFIPMNFTSTNPSTAMNRVRCHLFLSSAS